MLRLRSRYRPQQQRRRVSRHARGRDGIAEHAAREGPQPFRGLKIPPGLALLEHRQQFVRFDLIHRPLSDLFVVYNEQQLTSPPSPVNPGRGLIVKYTHMLAF